MGGYTTDLTDHLEMTLGHTVSMKAAFEHRISAEQLEEYVTRWRLQERLLQRGAMGVHRFLVVRS